MTDHKKRLEEINHRFHSPKGWMISKVALEDVDWLINRVKRLTEALEFYANIDNWEYTTYDVNQLIKSDDLGMVPKDKKTEFGGKIAREALEDKS